MEFRRLLHSTRLCLLTNFQMFRICSGSSLPCWCSLSSLLHLSFRPLCLLGERFFWHQSDSVQHPVPSGWWCRNWVPFNLPADGLRVVGWFCFYSLKSVIICFLGACWCCWAAANQTAVRAEDAVVTLRHHFRTADGRSEAGRKRSGDEAAVRITITVWNRKQ